MKIYRLRDLRHQTRMATSDDGTNFYALNGDMFLREFKITNERIDVLSLLAPIQPKTIYCIGLNYRKHAEETGAKIPGHPIVFLKARPRCKTPTAPSSCRATCAATRSTSSASSPSSSARNAKTSRAPTR